MRKIVSEMTYNASSGILNPTIPYHRKDCTIWTPTKTYEIGQNQLKLAE